MKRLFTLFTFLFASAAMIAQTANVQVIHNSPDPAAASVAVWVNNTKAFDNVPFRFASPYVPIPANVNVDVSITAAGAVDTSGAVLKKTFNLMADSSYVVVASGVTNNTALFDSIKPLDLVASPARMMARSSGNTDVLVYHGVIDAGGVSVDETSVPVPGLISMLKYGEFTSYLELGTMDYELAVNSLAAGVTVAVYSAPLQTLGLADSSLVVLASGVVNNIVGTDTLPGFGLYAALPTGGALVPLPVVSGIGTDEFLAGELEVFPIPSEGFININTSSLQPGDAELKVLDMQGQVIQNISFSVADGGLEVFDFNHLSRGMYFITIEDSSGQRYIERITLK